MQLNVFVDLMKSLLYSSMHDRIWMVKISVIWQPTAGYQRFVYIYISWSDSSRCGRCVPADTLRNIDVVITSKRRHFDVITSKWRRFDVITTLSLRRVFRGVWPGSSHHQSLRADWLEQLKLSIDTFKLLNYYERTVIIYTWSKG